MNKIVLLLSSFFFTLTSVVAQQTDTTANTKADSLKSCNNRSAITVIYERPRSSDRAVTVFTSVLDGQVAGLQSTNGGGQPGAIPELLIRGIGSLSASTEPLLVVNGAAYSGNIASLNLHDIESITVLKDAAATVAYGNRSANGVLQIVTREKVDYGHKLTLDVKTGIVTRGISEYDKLQAKEYYETMYTAIAGIPTSVVQFLGGYNAFNVPDNELFTADGKINPKASLKYNDDWVKETQRIGFKQDYNIATSGAGKSGSYYLAGGYLSEKGYIKSTGFERGNLSFNGTLKILPWLKAGLFATGTLGNQHYIESGTTSYNNPFFVARLMPPAYPVYYRNVDGAKEIDPFTGKDKYDWGTKGGNLSSMGERIFVTGSNIVGSLALDNRQRQLRSFLANPYVEFNFLKQFSYNTSFHYNYGENEQHTDYSPYSAGGAAYNGINGTTLFKNRVYSWNQVLTWSPNYQDHHTKVTAGYESYQQRYSYRSGTTLGGGINGGGSSYLHYTTVEGFSLNGTYDFKEKYFFDAGIRRDQTSNLAPAYRWNNYWAVKAGYDISKENWLKNSDWLKQLKIHASYGTQGNSGFMGIPSGTVAVDLRGEKFKHFNIGIDFLTIGNKFQVTLDAYKKNNSSDELITQHPLPPGVPGPALPVYNNIGIVNKGIELSIYATAVRTNKARWTTRLTATHNRNSITLPNDQMLFSNPYSLKSGGSVYDLYLPQYAGPSPATGEALYYFTTPTGYITTTNDYGLLTSIDYKKAGSTLPWLYGSLTNAFSYKQFDLSFQLCYSLGGKYYDQVYADLMGNGLNGNWSPDILNHWTPQNTATDIPRVNIYDQYANATSDRFLKNASYLNIKNIYLGYNFAPPRLKKAKLKTLTVYLTAENLWLFTASKGMDPQASFDGMGRYNYLPARTIMIGINAGL